MQIEPGEPLALDLDTADQMAAVDRASFDDCGLDLGHRLGLLMKADMLRWLATDRPEVAATDTWNATTNHHMIAVDERLGCRVVAHHETYRLDV